MPYKHIEDKRAYMRHYYQEHKEEFRQRHNLWYADHKNDPGFRQKRNDRQRVYRLRKNYGL